MNAETKVNNKVFLSGKIFTEPKFSHELYGEGFYEFTLEVPRLSEQKDYIPITISERLMGIDTLTVGKKISFYGQFRSFNKMVGEKSKLMLNVFVKDFVDESGLNEDYNPNVAELTGYICKPPVYRTTPFNREICDMLIAVNRAYDKSDYIPCIAWGRNARYVKNFEVGQCVSIAGRIQSREYHKKLDDGTTEVRTAYELSINKIFTDDNSSGFKSGDESVFNSDKEHFPHEGKEHFPPEGKEHFPPEANRSAEENPPAETDSADNPNVVNE